jgi:hypothetical protein
MTKKKLNSDFTAIYKDEYGTHLVQCYKTFSITHLLNKYHASI